MKKKYNYIAFGLNIQSDFEIPELLSFKGTPDVEIQIGEVPDKLDVTTQQGVRYQATKNEFLLKLDNIASYYISNGEKITIKLFKPGIDKEVRLFLLGSTFGALLLQRGLLPIHGSAIKFKNTASIFTGLSGAGKSSIAAQFIKQGYSFLADDISVINKKLEIVPGFPTMKIWNDVLKVLDIKKEKNKKVREDLEKYSIPVNKNFGATPAVVGNIIIIATKNSPGFEYEELKGIKKFNSIKNNTFRYRYVKGLEIQEDHFNVINKLLPQVKVYYVQRPQHPLSLNKFSDFLLNTLKLNA